MPPILQSTAFPAPAVQKCRPFSFTEILATTLVGGLLIVVITIAACVTPCHAQQDPAPAQQPPANAQRPPANGPQVERAQHRGPGQELVHETREAAGEEKDETDEFKKSTSVQLVSRITGLSLSNAYLFCVVLNFVVIALVIVWAGRKYLPALFSARTAAIQKAMREAQKASEEARRKLAEIETRLMKLDVEIGMMRDRAEKEAAEEEARIHAAAQEEARRIIEGAQQEIAAATKAARRELTAYAADLAVGLAQKQIRVDASTDQALVRSFADELGMAGPGLGRPSRKDGN
jgi:F-type H+-transporting ATPase subunit b